jgi:hypothetical protein
MTSAATLLAHARLRLSRVSFTRVTLCAAAADARSLIGRLNSANELKSLLPPTNEYELRGDLSVYFEQPTHPLLGPVHGECDRTHPRVSIDGAATLAPARVPAVSQPSPDGSYIALLIVIRTCDDDNGHLSCAGSRV